MPKSWPVRRAAWGAVLGAMVVLLGNPAVPAQMTKPPAITFNTAFPGGSLGRIEALEGDRFRCYVAGQADKRGHNRQASWYYFRMDGVRGRDLVLTLTDFIGEYNDRPGAVPMNADTVPVFSEDGETWKHFPAMEWDNEKKEATLRLRPTANTVWIAHQPPYTGEHLGRLLALADRSPYARREVIGKTVQGRDLNLVTVTDWDVPDAGKHNLWLQARQHAWESGTSYVLDGALRFLLSDDPAARELRRTTVFSFLPMGDPDGTANGQVRFNANGYDVNRHWNEVDLRSKAALAKMPEIWSTKKALATNMAAGKPIELLVNLHNTETGEYIAAAAGDDAALRARVTRLYDGLVARTRFDPSRNAPGFSDTSGSMTGLWPERRVPVVLMELRTATTRKLGRRPTVQDRLDFGRELLFEMAAATAGGAAK